MPPLSCPAPQAAHTDAVTHYNALLTELVKDCDASWREAWPRLAKDPQVRAGGWLPLLQAGLAKTGGREQWGALPELLGARRAGWGTGAQQL